MPKSDLGWIKCTTLGSYDGPGVHFDTDLNQIVAKHSFSVTSNGLTHTLNDALIRGLVSRDNHRGSTVFSSVISHPDIFNNAADDQRLSLHSCDCTVPTPPLVFPQIHPAQVVSHAGLLNLHLALLPLSCFLHS